MYSLMRIHVEVYLKRQHLRFDKCHVSGMTFVICCNLACPKMETKQERVRYDWQVYSGPVWRHVVLKLPGNKYTLPGIYFPGMMI